MFLLESKFDLLGPKCLKRIARVRNSAEREKQIADSFVRPRNKVPTEIQEFGFWLSEIALSLSERVLPPLLLVWIVGKI